MARSQARWFFLALAVTAFVSLAVAFGARGSSAQTADTDADGYPDEMEARLGSSATDPNSTPEHFSLLWTCTDGNDNDHDGTGDFSDPGCKNTTLPGSPTPTPAPVPEDAGTGPSQTPAPVAPGPSGPGNGGGAGSGGSGGSTGGGGGTSNGGGGSGSGATVAEIAGSGALIGGTSAADALTGNADGAGLAPAASNESNSAAGVDGGATGAGDQSASKHDSGVAGLPLMASLFFLVALLCAGGIGASLLMRRRRGHSEYFSKIRELMKTG